MRILPLLLALAIGLAAQQTKMAAIGKESRACMACHQATTPGIVGQWKLSSHSRNGVGCFECHAAEKGDKDAIQHNGFRLP